MYRLSFCALVMGVAMVVTAPAARADFSGYYDPINWTVDLQSGNGSVTPNGFTSVDLVSNNNGLGGLYTLYSITAGGTGLLTFDWNYVNRDFCCEFEIASFVINSTVTPLAQDDASGSVSVLVNLGDLIVFRNLAIDGFFASSTLTISNFSAPLPDEIVGDIPEPSTPDGCRHRGDWGPPQTPHRILTSTRPRTLPQMSATVFYRRTSLDRRPQVCGTRAAESGSETTSSIVN
jgi:hypothetical protein